MRLSDVVSAPPFVSAKPGQAHLQDGPVALFHHVQLHKHEPGPSDGAQSLRTSGLDGGRLCQASGGRDAHRQASLGPAVSSICRTSTQTRALKTVSVMYALEWHNPLL
jgi:hypothetical protein